MARSVRGLWTVPALLLALGAQARAGEVLAWADFTGFDGSHPPRLNNVVPRHGDGVSPNPRDGRSIVFHKDGARFEAAFFLDRLPRRATLAVRHLSSHDRGCRDEGWSPVTITLNGRTVAAGHSPAGHGYMVDEWPAGRFLRQGMNTLVFRMEGFCSQYWLQAFSVREGRPAAAAGGAEWARPATPRETALIPAPGPEDSPRQDEPPRPPRRRGGGPSPLAVLALLAAALAGVYAMGVRRGRATTAPPGSGPAAAATRGRSVPAGELVAGKYSIEGEIGHGGMGAVYAARDTVLGRKVAVKRMLPELAEDAEARRRFLQEARIIGKLTHPYIVSLYDVVEDGGEAYLVFEFVDGRTLSALLAERKRLPLGEASRLMNHVCQAVEAAHANRVLHRDLKPSNIMVAANGFAKVMDFGVAREAKDSISRLTRKDSSGTPAYMAPEQHLGQAHRASDVYALGVCLYEALTGQLPFPGPDFLVQKERRKYVPPQFIASGLPQGLEALMDAVLEPDHRKRIGDPLDLWERLRALAPEGGA